MLERLDDEVHEFHWHRPEKHFAARHDGADSAGPVAKADANRLGHWDLFNPSVSKFDDAVTLLFHV
ncbi:MAG: hypothetical protein AAF743_17270, partial [Planctomycetota bacterium]